MQNTRNIFYNLIFSFLISLLIVNVKYFNGLPFLILNFLCCIYIIFHFRQIEFQVFRNSMLYFFAVYFIYGLNNPILLTFDLWLIVLCCIFLKLQALHCVSVNIIKNIVRFINFLLVSDLMQLSYIVIYTALKGIRYGVIAFIFILNSLIYHYLFHVMKIEEPLKKRLRKFSIASYIYYYFTGYFILLSLISLNNVVTIAFVISAILFLFRNTPNQMHTIFGVSNFIMFISYSIYNSMNQAILIFNIVCCAIMLKNIFKRISCWYLSGYLILWFNIVYISVLGKWGVGIEKIFFSGLLYCAVLLCNLLVFDVFVKDSDCRKITRIIINTGYFLFLLGGLFYLDLYHYTVLVLGLAILKFCEQMNSKTGRYIRYWALFPMMIFYKAAMLFSSGDFIFFGKYVFLLFSVMYFLFAARLLKGKTRRMLYIGLILFVNILLYRVYRTSNIIYAPYLQLLINASALVFLKNIEFKIKGKDFSLLKTMLFSIDSYIALLMIILATEVVYFSDPKLSLFHFIQMVVLLTLGMYPLLKKIIRKEL